MGLGGEEAGPGGGGVVRPGAEGGAVGGGVGGPDRGLGEAGQAYVALSPGAEVGTSDLMYCCVGTLPPIRRPKRIILVDRIPRNAVGKVRRDELP